MTIYIAFAVLWIIVFYMLWAAYRLDALGIEKGRFPGRFLDGLHRHAHIAPLRHFVDNDEDLTKKGELIKDRLQKANLTGQFSVRSYMALSAIVLAISLIVGAFIAYTIQFSEEWAMILLSVEIEEVQEGINIRQTTLIMMFFLLLALFPNMYLKQRAKKQVAAAAKELPILQMFTILMLKSSKTVSEILYALSKLDSKHKKVFLYAYRIYVRNPKEAMNHLREAFKDSRFADMFDLLEDVSEYAREETIIILESSMKSLVEETNDIRRKNDLSRLVYSQASMVAPYTAIILLGAAPIIVMGINLFSSSMAL